MLERRSRLRRLFGNSRGISLPETIVAVSLISIGAFAAVVIQRVGVKSNQVSYSREVATSLARQLVESVESLDYVPTGTFANCLNPTGGSAFVNPCAALSPANPLDASGANQLGGIYTRRWHVSEAGTQDATTANTKTIRVQVQWNERGQTQTIELATVKGW